MQTDQWPRVLSLFLVYRLLAIMLRVRAHTYPLSKVVFPLFLDLKSVQALEFLHGVKSVSE